MAKKTTEKPTEHCNKCINCTSWYNKNYKGDFILGKCSVSGFEAFISQGNLFMEKPEIKFIDICSTK